jgi:chitinase
MKCWLQPAVGVARAVARSNNFHGLDLDWEYPSTKEEMTNFGSLLNEW